MLAVVALVFGANVAKYLGPFGFDDPATESVRGARGRRARGGLRPRSRADRDRAAVHAQERRAHGRAAARRAGDGARAVVYSTGDRTMVSRDGRATFVVALFKPLDDRVRDRAAKRIEKQFAHDPTVTLGGGVIGYEQVGRTVEDDLLRAETIAFPLLIPSRSGSSAGSSRRCCRRSSAR